MCLSIGMAQFKPIEIIFSSTVECNLHCPHCFVNRDTQNLSIEKASRFLESCKNTSIERVGFSGGEPFLYPDFLVALCEKTIQMDLLFDRIMTNGVWWNTEEELTATLERIYNAGFDGKIGLSFDSFHGQDIKKITLFIKAVYNIWQEGDVLEIQSVVNKENPEDTKEIIEKLLQALPILEEYTPEYDIERNNTGIITLQNNTYFLPIYRFNQSYLSSKGQWNDKKWFIEDYCQGPGHVLYVQASGKISPCCGFANENPALQIGNIEDDFKVIMEHANKNPMIQTCYVTGLEAKRKELEKQGHVFPGKTEDMCMFCDYICNLE